MFSGQFNVPGMPTGDEDKGPRLFQAQRSMTLAAAFEVLKVNPEWLPEFKASGAHWPEIRYKWRQAVLKSHPDRQPRPAQLGYHHR